MNLKTRFLLIFLTIATIPLLIITTFTYDRYTTLVKEQTAQVSDTILEKAVIAANNSISEIQDLSRVFNFYSENSESIVDNLSKYRENGPSYSSYDIWESNRTISFIIRNFIFNYDYVNGVYVFTPTGPILGYGNNLDIRADYDPKGDAWYEKTLEKGGKLYAGDLSVKSFTLGSSASTPSISFSQAIYDVYTHDFLGVLFIDCKPSVFSLSDVNTLPDMALLAVENESGSILYSNADDLKPGIHSKATRIKKVPLVLDSLTLLFAVNYTALYEEFGYTRIIILAISMLCLVGITVVSVFLSHSVSKPIIHLSKAMAAQDGKQLLPSTKYLNRTDEIGVLYNEYNRMLETLSVYIKKELQNKLITLDSQMKSLEAQINSHFLYNTLESINSIAELEEVETISIMSMALGDMFRYSIKTKSELVTVAEEIKHVKDYVSIQQIRFENRFKLILNIPDSLYSYKVLKLILQPLVENAFYHGLNYCRQGSRITIAGWCEGDFLYMAVSDDGMGMTAEQVAELDARLKEPPQFTELGQRNKQSIGIKNIHTRIVLYYGDGYGLHIESQPKEGTTMTLKLPVVFNC